MDSSPVVPVGALLTLVAFLGLLVLLAAPFVMYNRFVRQATLIDESWGQTDVELTRRHELVPNLVATVQGYAAHERAVLAELTRAREEARAHRADQPKSRQPYEDALAGAMDTVLARVEDYPDLKASAGFLQLQHELTHTEDRIAAARRFYNGNVRAYNTRVRTFPSNLVASVFGFEQREFFEITDAALRMPPGVRTEPGGSADVPPA